MSEPSLRLSPGTPPDAVIAAFNGLADRVDAIEAKREPQVHSVRVRHVHHIPGRGHIWTVSYDHKIKPGDKVHNTESGSTMEVRGIETAGTNSPMGLIVVPVKESVEPKAEANAIPLGTNETADLWRTAFIDAGQVGVTLWEDPASPSDVKATGIDDHRIPIVVRGREVHIANGKVRPFITMVRYRAKVDAQDIKVGGTAGSTATDEPSTEPTVSIANGVIQIEGARLTASLRIPDYGVPLSYFVRWLHEHF